MDSNYRKFDSESARCFGCLPFGKTPANEEAYPIEDIVRGLNVKLQGQFYKMNETQALAQQLAKKNDMDRARIELRRYHWKRTQYQKLLKIYERACIIKDTKEEAQLVVAVSKSFKRESKLTPKIDGVEMEQLLDEWDDVILETQNATQELGRSHLEAAQEEAEENAELEELKTIQLSFQLPNVPTTKIIQKKSEKNEEALVV